MDLSRIIGLVAVVLAVTLATGHALGSDSTEAPAAKEPVQKKIDEREAQRRATMAAHQKRKEDFARNCASKPFKTEAELKYCRAAYLRF